MSLAGHGVVVTRPRELAGTFAQLLERRGARVLIFPAIEIQPLPPPAELGRLADFDLVIFVSPSAVRVALSGLAWPRGLAVAAIGSGTKRELERAGIAPVIAPAAGADSEALLAAPDMQRVAGKRMLIVRGDGGRELLGDSLAARGARVAYAQCYRRVRPAIDTAPLLAAWRRGEVDAVTVLSAQALDNFIDMTGGALAAATPHFVPHPRVAGHAESRGVREIVIAAPGDDAMIERLVAYFDERD
ncbi:MAG TPA: uroporphyrinogen-III synthase [Burkholderiales bacterium]